MAIDAAHYEGREQAFVKHTFLDKYLPALIGKVCSRYDEFVYVDGFAGPWMSAAGQSFEDTSFGIALTHMTNQYIGFISRGRNVRMRAFLVEQNPDSFAQLRQAAVRYPKIEVIPLEGKMEDHAAAIAASIPKKAFSFTLIDPKGFPVIGSMMPLLQRPNAEALVNFMFDFANRFGGTDLIPSLQEWLSMSAPDDWREQIGAVSGEQREQLYVKLAVEALRRTPGYDYAPVITVDKVLHDRPLYKLIFLTRRLEGLRVYRDSERSALDVQAYTRSASKAKMRQSRTLTGDLFPDGSDAVPNDRSSQVIRRSKEEASRRLQAMIANDDSGVRTWKECWPQILAELSVTYSWLGRQINEWRKEGKISAPGWPNERTQIPRDEQTLKWIG